MKYEEIEFKYRADDISLRDFTAFCNEKTPRNYLEASGFDHFYSGEKDYRFCRHRIGADINQLTFKRKTEEKNNYVRTEHNIELDKSVSLGQIRALCKEFGYEYSSSLFKNCFIFKYKDHILVFYICYDTDMKELGRFVEIELDESIDFGGKEESMRRLTEIEYELKSVGIKPQARVKRSLFEMFGKK